MMLNLLNLFSLIIALFTKINSMNKQLDVLRCKTQDEFTRTSNATAEFLSTTVSSMFQKATSDLLPLSSIISMTTTMFSENIEKVTECGRILVNCSKVSKNMTKSMITSVLALNFSTTIFPEIVSHLQSTEISGTYPTDIMNIKITDFNMFETSTENINGTTTVTELPFNLIFGTTTEKYGDYEGMLNLVLR